MDIDVIARRIRLPPRKVRYVLDHGLLPGTRGTLQADLRGRPRTFTPLEAFFVACAALLLEAGVKRGSVWQLMDRIVAMPWPVGRPPVRLSPLQGATVRPRKAMEAMYYWAREATVLEVGDGVHLRLLSGSIDTGWVAPPTWTPLHPDYQPVISFRIDFTQLYHRCCFAATNPR
jgi:hypothetical protein